MRTLFIGMACVAASLSGPAALAQTASTAIPRARTVAVSGNSAYLGIGVQDIDAERAKNLKLKDDRGAEVTSVVDESPAAKAGMKEGDVVLEYNGQAVEGGEQLSRLVRETPVGRQVKIVVARNGANQTLNATIEAAKGRVLAFGDGGAAWVLPSTPQVQSFPKIEIPQFKTFTPNPTLGIYGEPLSEQEQLADFFGVKDGVLVRQVVRNSAAEKAGIKAGDVIVKVDDSRISRAGDIGSALRSKKSVTVTVVRNKKEMPISVTLDTPAAGSPVRAMMLPGVPGRMVFLGKPQVLQLLSNRRVI